MKHNETFFYVQASGNLIHKSFANAYTVGSTYYIFISFIFKFEMAHYNKKNEIKTTATNILFV